jgi:cell division septation protein DedD
MATSAGRSRLFPARSSKSYRLEMEGRTLYLLLSLMALTGVVIFYLGVVTGKALRDPNAPMPLSAQMGAPPAADKAPQSGALAFNEALKGDQKGVEGLNAEGKDAAQRTDALLGEAKKQLELKEVAPGKPQAPALAAAPAAPKAEAPRAAAPLAPTAPAPPRAPASAAKAPANPARAPAAAANDGSIYTVQVFSSKHQDSARQLVERLRGQGFAAYLNRFESADKEVWYRVRVGKTDRAGAEALQSRLRSEAKLRNPQIQKL